MDNAKQWIISAAIKGKNLPPWMNIAIQKNNLKNLAAAKNTTYNSDKSPLSLDFLIIYNWGKRPTDSQKIPKETNIWSVKYESPGLKKKLRINIKGIRRYNFKYGGNFI